MSLFRVIQKSTKMTYIMVKCGLITKISSMCTFKMGLSSVSETREI